MPSLVLSGHPCIGKTTFANLLASRALNHPSKSISRVIHIREATACPDQTKAECYTSSHSEKNTRASLKAEFDRAVTSSSSSGSGSNGTSVNSTLVILDSLNYIKGYRYELYCISKAAGEQHGVIWIMGSQSDNECVQLGVSSTSDTLAKKWNSHRKEVQLKKESGEDHTAQILEGMSGDIELDGYYNDDTMMDELVLRFEPPDEKNRWENPLYKVDVSSVLPWGKEGTLAHAIEGQDESKAGKEENEGGTDTVITNQMKDLEVKNTAAPTPPAAVKKKSASGFKRRTRKSAQQKLCTTEIAAPVVPANVPSSMASRNLKSDTAADNSGDTTEQTKQKMEDVIDSILNSFLTNTARLQEGLSTISQVSADSNALNLIDNITQRINNDILKAQKAASLSAGVGGRIFIDNGKRGRRTISLSKPMYVNELRTFRRQFLKWIAGHPMPNGTGEEDLVENYIAYIERCRQHLRSY